MKTKRNKSTGFTLIELLVVVAIILLLLAILTPALGRALSTAELAECASQHAQLGKTSSGFQVDDFGMFRPMGQFMREFEGTPMMTDPADRDPINIQMKAKDWGKDGEINLSVGLNGEYSVFNLALRHIKNPDHKVLFYDGLSGDGSGSGAGAGGSGGGNGRKISFDHLPPGNTQNKQYITVSVSAAAAHLGHGDNLTGAINDPWDVADYARGEFDARHPFGEGLGNVLFVDGHVEAHPQLNANMFNYQQGSSDSGGGTSTGGGGGGSSGGGKGKGKGKGKNK